MIDARRVRVVHVYNKDNLIKDYDGFRIFGERPKKSIQLRIRRNVCESGIVEYHPLKVRTVMWFGMGNGLGIVGPDCNG